MNQMTENKNKWNGWSCRLLMLAVAFVMIFCVKNTANAAGTQVVDLQKSGSVYAYSGKWEDSDTAVYHRIVVKKSGVLAVAGTSISEYTGSRYGLSIALCDKNKRVLERYQSSYVSTDDVASYWVKPGTYYILVKNQKYYVVSASMKSMADRGGASKKKATTIKYNKKITGVMPVGEKGSKADWFKFKVTKDKKLRLDVQAEGSTTVYMYIYGPSYKKGTSISLYNQAKKCYSVNGFSGKKIKIKKGTYYIKVVRATKNKAYSAGYSIKWKLQ